MASDAALRVGLVGLGGVCSAVHYPGLARIPGVVIAAVCDTDPAVLRQRCQGWGAEAGYPDLGALLRDARPDAVVVATPNVWHRDLVLEALAAGCHVLCEKPLALDSAQARQMYEAARGSGRRHMTAFTYRFVPGMSYLRHLVRSGRLGQVRHARFQRLQDWGEGAIGWRQYRDQAGSGELGDMGIHRLDFAEDLLGPIRSVCGAMKQWAVRDRTPDGRVCRAQDVEDWAAWLAEFAGGATGVFEMGKLTRGRGPDGGHDVAELNGTEASAAYQLHTPHQVLFARRGEPYAPLPVPTEFLKRPGSPRDPEEGDPQVTFRYDQEWEFVSAIRENRDCVPSFYHGVRAVCVAESIAESAHTRRWVDVPPVPA